MNCGVEENDKDDSFLRSEKFGDLCFRWFVQAARDCATSTSSGNSIKKLSRSILYCIRNSVCINCACMECILLVVLKTGNVRDDEVSGFLSGLAKSIRRRRRIARREVKNNLGVYWPQTRD